MALQHGGCGKSAPGPPATTNPNRSRRQGCPKRDPSVRTIATILQGPLPHSMCDNEQFLVFPPFLNPKNRSQTAAQKKVQPHFETCLGYTGIVNSQVWYHSQGTQGPQKPKSRKVQWKPEKPKSRKVSWKPFYFSTFLLFGFAFALFYFSTFWVFSALFYFSIFLLFGFAFALFYFSTFLLFGFSPHFSTFLFFY